MILYVLDTELNKIDVIDVYTSVIWTNRYDTPGDFELYLPISIKALNALKADYYLVRDGYEENAMIISNIQITTDAEIGNYLLISGKCLKSILNRRIIWNQTTVVGTVENGIRQLINENAITPTDTTRVIPYLELGTAKGFTARLNAQFTGDNLGETIATLCQTYGYGYDVKLDVEEKKFIFELYQGTDRSYAQSENPHIVFSNEFENILNSAYVHNRDNMKNVAKVAGEGEGLARRTATIGTASGLNRYELFVDAKDVSSNDGEISDSEYNAALQERGNEALAEYGIVEALDGQVDTSHGNIYDVDYFMGDIVEVVNEYGIETTSRIVEVIESEDETGIYTIPTFRTT